MLDVPGSMQEADCRCGERHIRHIDALLTALRDCSIKPQLRQIEERGSDGHELLSVILIRDEAATLLEYACFTAAGVTLPVIHPKSYGNYLQALVLLGTLISNLEACREQSRAAGLTMRQLGTCVFFPTDGRPSNLVRGELDSPPVHPLSAGRAIHTLRVPPAAGREVLLFENNGTD